MLNPITQASRVVPAFSITFEKESQFTATESALKKIASGPKGRQLIRAVEQASTDEKQVRIIVNDGPDDISGASGAMTSEIKANYKGSKDVKSYEYNHKIYEYATNGKGVSPLIYYNPNQSILVDFQGLPRSVNSPDAAFIGLAHELVHAYYMMKGQGFGTEPATSALNDPEHLREERRAVGYGEYENTSLSENAIRREHGLNIRKQYFEF